MLTRRKFAGGVGLTLISGAAAAEADAPYWPQDSQWQSATLDHSGLDLARAEAAIATMLAANSASVLVLRRGLIVAERYAAGASGTSQLEVASVAKSMLSVLIGMAIDQGKIKGLQQSASDFVPQWRATPKAAITVRHLLTMTSGLDFRGLQVRGVSGDQFALNAAAPLRDPPGTHWAYATPIYHLLFHVIARAVGERFEDYAQRMLLGPLGMTQTTWVTNLGAGAAGPVTNYYSARCSARDLGRFGLFALRGGVWRGRRLLSADYLRDATAPSQTLNRSYGYLWWENREPGFPAVGGLLGYRFPGSPHDIFAALGAGGQIVVISPSLDLVMVRQGGVTQERALQDYVAGVCGSALATA